MGIVNPKPTVGGISDGKEINMSYKVTITNNETGAVLVNEENAVAMVGAIGNEQGTRSIVLAACDAISLGDAISAAEDVISQLKTEPEVKLVLELKALMDKRDGVKLKEDTHYMLVNGELTEVEE